MKNETKFTILPPKLDIKCYFYRHLLEKKCCKHVLAPYQECEIILGTLDVIYNMSNQDILAPSLIVGRTFYNFMSNKDTHDIP